MPPAPPDLSRARRVGTPHTHGRPFFQPRPPSHLSSGHRRHHPLLSHPPPHGPASTLFGAGLPASPGPFPAADTRPPAATRAPRPRTPPASPPPSPARGPGSGRRAQEKPEGALKMQARRPCGRLPSRGRGARPGQRPRCRSPHARGPPAQTPGSSLAAEARPGAPTPDSPPQAGPSARAGRGSLPGAQPQAHLGARQPQRPRARARASPVGRRAALQEPPPNRAPRGNNKAICSKNKTKNQTQNPKTPKRIRLFILS